MSKGRLGDFADDADSVFIDEPMPRIGRYLLVVIVGAVFAYLAARHAGVGVPLALVASFAASSILGGLTSLPGILLRRGQSREREPGVEEFDAIRRAGTRALEEFRAAHTGHNRVAWSLVAATERGRAIKIIATRSEKRTELAVTATYLVTRDGASLALVSDDEYPGTGYSQRYGRPQPDGADP